jgi:hypothetical protein
MYVSLYHYIRMNAARVAGHFVIYYRLMFSNHFTLTKRQLGTLLLAAGILAFVAVLAVDVLDVGREGGIGPAQQVALAVSAFFALVGLSLIPLGSAPA